MEGEVTAPKTSIVKKGNEKRPELLIHTDLPEWNRDKITNKEDLLGLIDELTSELDRKGLRSYVKCLTDNKEKLFASKGPDEDKIWKECASDLITYIEGFVADDYGMKFVHEELAEGKTCYPLTIFTMARVALYNTEGVTCEITADEGKLTIDDSTFHIEITNEEVCISAKPDIHTYTWREYGELIMAEIGYGMYCLASGARQDQGFDEVIHNLFCCMLFILAYKNF